MKVAVFGETLFDIIEGEEHIGGAAFNFAAHMTKLGFDTHLISAVGEDALGREIMAKMRSLGMNGDFLRQTSEYPTGTVTVDLQNGEPEYTIHQHVAWDNITVEDSPALNYEMWDLFYFGTLAQRSEQNKKTLHTLLDETISARHIFFDVNLRQSFYSKETLESSLETSTILKTNKDEAALLAELFDGPREKDPVGIAEWLKSEFHQEIVIITQGSEGVYVSGREQSCQVPVTAVKTTDAVGAGDAFSAGFCFGILQGLSPEEAAGLGGKLGSFVASRRGAIPEYSQDIEQVFVSLGECED